MQITGSEVSGAPVAFGFDGEPVPDDGGYEGGFDDEYAAALAKHMIVED